MSWSPNESPHGWPRDLEAGFGDAGWDRTFDFTSTKNASVDRPRRRWRDAVLAINAARRFRYTLHLKRERDKEEISRKIRAYAQAVRSAQLFKVAEARTDDDFEIGLEQLKPIAVGRQLDVLRQCNGVRGLAQMLKTDVERGISGDDDDLLKRREAFGSNTYPRPRGRTFWRFLWEACQDVTLISLMLAAIASLLLQIKTKGINHQWYDEAGIAFTVILVIVVTAISDYKQSLRFEKLNEEKRNMLLEVVRGGKSVEISIYDIVVGDIIPLRIGDQVPADGVVFIGYSLQINESEIPGQRRTVEKDPVEDPFLFCGSKVESGLGTMLVTSVGVNTQWGLQSASIPDDTGEETPLQVYLNGIATTIGLISISLALAVFFIQSGRYFTGHAKKVDGTPLFASGKTKADEVINHVIKTIILGVTIVVVAVPDGLPLAVTLNLACTTSKMVGEKALVRRFSAFEVMGSVTTILCHKTGILTLNQMTVDNAWAGGIEMQHPNDISDVAPVLTSLILEGVAQNTNGSVFLPDGINAEPEVFGTPTERAILNWGLKLGKQSDDVRSTSSIVHVWPFNSDTKCGGVALKLDDSQVRVHWKGAAKTILSSCAWYMDKDKVVAMNGEKESYLKKFIEKMAIEGLHCAAIAYQTYEEEDFLSNGDHSAHPKDDLVLLAIMGIKDPCQGSITDAVQECRNAGVKVLMVTSDDLLTAKAIALECGISTLHLDTPEHNIIEGNTFRSLSEQRIEEIAADISVMAQASGQDIYRLVKALQNKGHVVATTGKGIHDIRALRQADVGLAMGTRATAVAKQNSGIIVLEDDFASIVKAIRWGRSFYTNIQKFVQFRLTVSTAALIICVIVALRSGHFPLNVVQILWVNLLIDIFGALALASEPPTDQLMKRPPIRKGEPFITKLMWAKFGIQVSYPVTAMLVLNFHGKSILQLKDNDLSSAVQLKNTVIFNSFVFCQVFNELECRNPGQGNIFKGILRNHMFLGIVTLTVIFQIILIECLGIFISTVRLDWKQWLISIGIGFFSQLANRFPLQAFPFLRD